MNLIKYDNKLVQITDKWNEVYEGIGEYSDKEYCLMEYGKEEDCIEILGFLFYKSNIKKIKCIKDFTKKYGKIEELIVDDGIDSIEDAFDYEENEHTYRILLCLEEKGINEEIENLLKKLIKYYHDKKIVKKVNEILKRKDE